MRQGEGRVTGGFKSLPPSLMHSFLPVVDSRSELSAAVLATCCLHSTLMNPYPPQL